jgi:hypothetical protein
MQAPPHLLSQPNPPQQQHVAHCRSGSIHSCTATQHHTTHRTHAAPPHQHIDGFRWYHCTTHLLTWCLPPELRCTSSTLPSTRPPADRGPCMPCGGWKVSTWHLTEHMSDVTRMELPIHPGRGQCVGQGRQLFLRSCAYGRAAGGARHSHRPGLAIINYDSYQQRLHA